MKINKKISYLVLLFILICTLFGCGRRAAETIGEVPTVSNGTAEIVAEPSTQSSEEPSSAGEISKNEASSDTTETPILEHVEDDFIKESEGHLESSSTPSAEETAKASPATKPAETTKPQSTPQPVTESQSKQQIDTNTGKDKYLTDPVPEGKPVPVEPQDTKVTDKSMTCTLSVSCATILDNMKDLDKEKIELVPEDGVIFKATEVTFYEGESVFNVLQREMKKNKIHMEFVNTPLYNSAYIEGINNLYEFDCGELSGWMYKVNGWFPNYGCSRYQLKEGDVIEWVYTCDLGRDVGDQYYDIGGE